MTPRIDSALISSSRGFRMANGSSLRGFVVNSYSVKLSAMDPEVTGQKASLHLTKLWSFKDRFTRILTGSLMMVGMNLIQYEQLMDFRC